MMFLVSIALTRLKCVGVFWPHLSVDVAQRPQQADGAVRRAARCLNALQQLLHRRLQLLLLRLHFHRETLVMKHTERLQGSTWTQVTTHFCFHTAGIYGVALTPAHSEFK